MRERCAWAAGPVEIPYHDEEWGEPLHSDVRLFEFLVLEGAQAGLSWTTILKKREGYRQAYRGFDPSVVAGFDDADTTRLLGDVRIVRNRLKVASSISNAKHFLAVQTEFGSFDVYLWAFVGGSPQQNNWSTSSDVPATTATSDALSKDLRRRGFRFVGSTICYALMQATGMVNDHLTTCFRHAELLPKTP